MLQNATEVYYKMRQNFYYKMRQLYYKMRQVLQIAAILLQNATVITKCDVYYQLRQYISCQTVYCDSTYVRVVLHRQVSQRFTLPWKIFPNCKNKLKNQLLKVLLSKYTQSKKQSSFHV